MIIFFKNVLKYFIYFIFRLVEIKIRMFEKGVCILNIIIEYESD